jgi:hypothetical protein
VTGVAILFAVLLLPIGVWLLVRWLPEQRARQTPRGPATGPRRRWWQP